MNVIDDYSRECLARIIDTSLSGRRVVRELTSHAVLARCQDTGVEWHDITPGKPLQNGFWNRSLVACALRA